MLNQQPYIWYQFQDASESLGTQRYHVQRGAGAAAAMSAASELRGALRGVSGCSVLEQQFVIPSIEENPIAPLPAADSRYCGVFVFACDGTNQYAILVIGGIRTELLETEGQGAGLLIRQDNPAVAALITELTSGRWINKFGYVITAVEAAYLQVRDAVFIPDWL